MKKVIISLSIIAVLCAAVATAAISTDFFSSGMLFEKENTSKDAVKSEITVSVGDGLVEKDSAKYDHSISGKDGAVIDFYKSENGNEYAVNDDGNVILGYIENTDEKLTTPLKSKDEARAMALKWMATLTDDVSRFTEKNLKVRGTGEDKKYYFDYYEYLYGCPTENAVSIRLDAYGNMISFYCKDDVDYSGLSSETIENITDEELNLFVAEKLKDNSPKGIKALRSPQNGLK